MQLIEHMPDKSKDNANSYLEQIERQLGRFMEIVKDNNMKQDEIKSLRDGVGSKSRRVSLSPAAFMIIADFFVS